MDSKEKKKRRHDLIDRGLTAIIAISGLIWTLNTARDYLFNNEENYNSFDKPIQGGSDYIPTNSTNVCMGVNDNYPNPLEEE